MIQHFIIPAFLILSHSLSLPLSAALLPMEEGGVPARRKRSYTEEDPRFQQSRILPKRSRVTLPEAMEVDGNFQSPLMMWIEQQPQARWSIFMSLFKAQNWTVTQWTTADWAEVMCYSTLQKVIQDGSLRQAIEGSPSPEVQALLPHVPLSTSGI